MIQGACKFNLGSSNKENLGSGEHRVKFWREREEGDPPWRASLVTGIHEKRDPIWQYPTIKDHLMIQYNSKISDALQQYPKNNGISPHLIVECWSGRWKLFPAWLYVLHPHLNLGAAYEYKRQDTWATGHRGNYSEWPDRRLLLRTMCSSTRGAGSGHNDGGNHGYGYWQILIIGIIIA